MRTQSADTAPEIERRQILRVRELSVARKFAAIRSTAMMLVSANIAAAHLEQTPERTSADAHDAAKFVTRQYGLSVSPELAMAIDQRRGQAHGQFDIQAALLDVTGALHDMRIRYALVGQLACALYGFPRPVFTLDLLTNSPAAQLAAFSAQPNSGLLMCEPTGAQDPVSAKQQNALAQLDFLHLPTLVKITVHRARASGFFQGLTRHACAITLIEGTYPVLVAVPEDVVLTEIMAFQRSRDDDRWNDMLGVLKVQMPSLNLPALSELGERLGISQLLHQAVQDAGIAV
ncbi:MAG TPA: hypothetical protein VMV29_02525 [Ktedonobacterales bacterium]|nr:hypothetical protein [Ktedonobacterales bacterium]